MEPQSSSPVPTSNVPAMPPSAPQPAINTSPGSPPAVNPYGTPRGGSGTLKIVLIVVGAVLAAGIAVVAYLFMMGMQVVNASNNFVKYETSGDTEKALTYTSATTDSEKAFIRQASTATKGTSKMLAHKAAGTKVYFVYSLTNPTYKYARTTLEKVDGKWKVTSYVYSSGQLAVLPSANDAATGGAAETTPTGSCLVASDFGNLYKDINGATLPSNRDYSKATNPYTQNVHFKADTLNFDDPVSLATGLIQAFADFAKQNSGKSFTVHLRGSVGTTSSADLDFARQRADKVKALLVSDGADSSKIVVDTPGSVADYGDGAGDATNRQTARNVVMKIDPTCSASSSTGR